MMAAAGSAFYAMYVLGAPAELDTELVEGQVLKRQLFTPNVPYPLWDYNWDGKMTKETSMKGQLEGRGDVYGTVRHILLVRHGQYEENVEGVDGDKNDKLRKLTPLGRVQAEQTGKWLAKIQQGIDKEFGPCNIKIVRSSDMTRARETAEIIAKHLKGVKLAPPDRRLNEAL
jgi:serine/threonine-protein phosphatase PGAM5